MTEDEMVGRHHQLNGHEFGYAVGVGDGQGGLSCCSSWSRKESDTIIRESLIIQFSRSVVSDSLRPHEL